MYLIDTNVISESRKRSKADGGVRAFFKRVAEEDARVFISVVTVGELRRDSPQLDGAHHRRALEPWADRAPRRQVDVLDLLLVELLAHVVQQAVLVEDEDREVREARLRHQVGDDDAGEKTGDEAVARTVAYALAMGKKPVVVNDCPGFLVNRILLPYLGAFMGLVRRGVDFLTIDRVMEAFGWPMGPAYLCDVVGIDTGVHAGAVMAEGFPDRMKYDFKTSHDVMFENERLGQKNGRGYYRYEADKKGRPKKVVDAAVAELLAPVIEGSETLDEETIVDSMMIPMCLEAVRCLEDGIAASATDVDLALVYGIGFPPFRGGALHYIDDFGVADFVARADELAATAGPLKAMYLPTEKLREMAANGDAFFA